MKHQSYTAKIAKNSFWATGSFIVASVCNFVMSVAITRYFGKEVYGQYSYFLWLSGVFGILAGFGFQQTLNKFLPKYFFAKDGDAGSGKSMASEIFKKLLRIQIVAATVMAALCIAGGKYFEQLINFDHPQKNVMVMIAFLAMIPFSLNTFFSSSLAAIQEFKTASKIYIGTTLLNLLMVIIFVTTSRDIVSFLWLYLGLSTISSGILLYHTGKIFRTDQKTLSPQKEITGRHEKLFAYSTFAYISIICTQIVWERSELLFLGMFSDSSQIAIYTLAYSLAVLFISVWGPVNSVLNATTAEVAQSGKDDKLMMITQHGTKYMAMLMLPLALLASLFLGDIVTLVYGKSFADVAMLFPLLALAHAMAVIITPAGSIPMLKNEMKKSMYFNITTAAVNILLDIYLIAKYQAVGAMLANVISQGVSIMLSLINARKYRLGIFNTNMIKVLIINFCLGTIFFLILPLPITARIIIALAATTIYGAVTIKTALNQRDADILGTLKTHLPKPLRWITVKITDQIPDRAQT